MSWPLLMLLQNIGAAIFALYSRRIAHRFHHATLPLNIINYGIIALSGLLYGLLHGLSKISMTSFGHFAGFFLFAGACFAITNILSFVVFEYVDAAIASLLSVLNVIAAVVLSTLIIHEGLTTRQLIGALVIFTGMHLVLTINLTRYKHKRLWSAVLLSLLASIFFALAITTEKYLLNHVNLSTYLVFGWGFQFMGVLTVSLFVQKLVRANFALLKRKKFWVLASQAGLVRMLSGLLFIYSLKLSNNLSLISVFSGLKVILVALLGAYYLRELDYLKRKLQAAVLSALGVAIMLWK